MSPGHQAPHTPIEQRAQLLDLLSGLVAVALIAVVAAGLVSPARELLALVFAFFVPGRAIVSNSERLAQWSGIGMSIAISLGVLTLLATVCLWARFWHPLALFQVEAVASLIGLGMAVFRKRRNWVTVR